MKKRIALIALALAGILQMPVVFPLVSSAHFKAGAFQRTFKGTARKSSHAQSPENTQSSLRRDSPALISETSGTLFENVLTVLEQKYYDVGFRNEVLPKLASQYSDRAKRATTLREQREVVQEFLSLIPASHLGLLSKQSYHYFIADLQGRPYPTFGFQLVEIKGKFYTHTLLEEGPAQRAGLLAWDRIVSIDGVPVAQSQRVDWRSDDAYIKDDFDPPVHFLIAAKGDTIRLKVERSPNKFITLDVPAEDYSAFAAARASARVYRAEGRSFGYLHFWYVHMNGVPELLKQKLEGEFRDCDALILDLRGRGGNGRAIARIIEVLRADSLRRPRRPIVALVDRQSRSAKDVLAYLFKKNGLARLVGERTAGAVVPATFADVGHETILMFPSFKLPRYTDLLELKPVEPDVFVKRAGPLSAGNDPILKAGLAEALKLAKASSQVSLSCSWHQPSTL